MSEMIRHTRRTVKSSSIILTAVALAALSSPHASAQPVEPRAYLGRCHMDICSWEIDLAKKLLGKNQSGSLFELTVKTGTSFHKDGSYARRSRIKWDSAPRSAWIFCSRQYPAIMVEGDSAFRATILTFAGRGAPGAMESAARTYFRVCHSVSGNADITRAARRLGYPPSERDFSDLEGAIKKPEDILSVTAARK
jgi:hypothetical protein